MPLRINLLPSRKPKPKLEGIEFSKVPTLEGKARFVAVQKGPGNQKAGKGCFSFSIVNGKGESVAFSGISNIREVFKESDRGKGIGGTLLKMSEQEAKRKQCAKFIVETRQASTARLLLNQGYRITNREKLGMLRKDNIRLLFPKGKADLIIVSVDGQRQEIGSKLVRFEKNLRPASSK